MRDTIRNIYKTSVSKNSVIGMWLRSLAILLFLTIIFTLQSYFVSDWLYRSNTARANRLLTNQIATAIDVKIHSAQQTLRKLLMDRNAAQLAQADDIYDIGLTPVKIELIERMKSYLLASDMINNFQLYFPAQDYMISSNTLAVSEIIHYSDYKDYVNDYPTWRALFLGHDTGDLFIMSTIKSKLQTGRSNRLYYVQSGKDVPGGANACAYFSIEGTNFSPQISAMSADNDMALMLANGTVFVSSNYEFFETLNNETELLNVLGQCGPEPVGLSSKHGDIYVAKSAYTDLFYVIHASGGHGLYSRLPLVIVSVAGVLTILLATAIIMLKHTKSTIAPLMEIRSMLTAGDLDREDSELKQIRDAIYASKERMATISSELDVNRAKLERSDLQTLLIGGVPEEESAALTADLGFGRDGFAVMMFSLAEHEWPLKATTEAAVFLVLRYEDISQTMSGAGIALKYLVFDDAFVLAANLDGNDADKWAGLADGAAHDLLLAWDEQFDVQLAYAYSGISVGPDALARSYAEARLTMRYKLLNDFTYRPDQRKASESPHYYFPSSERNRLVNLIKSGSQKEVERLIYELWRENVSGEFSDILLDCLSNDIAGAIMSISGLALLDPNAKRSFLTRLAYMQKQRPEYRRDALVELARAARAQFGLSKPSEQDDFYDKIVNYVKEHYSDPMLSVEGICAHFGRSHNTVYSVVKDRSGEGVLYLINTVRLRRAKELLLQPGATVEKAAQAVGLSSALALFRIFKRYEGVTPSQFINQDKKK